MRNFGILLSLLILLTSILLMLQCSRDNVDKVKPVINMDIDDAFPVNCDTLCFGDTVTISILFTDNVELGSKNAYSIDIHNNFDHHSHSTSIVECDQDGIKDPVNPYLLLQSFDIPEGVNFYNPKLKLEISSKDKNGVKYDEGDYHFFISVSDKEGWSAQKGLSIKILYR